MSETDDGKLRDSEIALMDAIRTIFEVLVAKNIAPPETLAKALEHWRQEYSREDMSRARFVMDVFCDSLRDPTRKALR